MISFVNAKINIGLQIVRKREDGYHDLQTVFYPVGLYAGTAENPESFCDIIELTGPVGKGSPALPEFILTGRKIDCPLEKNLIYKAADLFCRETGADFSETLVSLEKYLPDGAGMGGGSADAGFILKMMASAYNDIIGEGEKISDESLCEMALQLGADCPFFIINRPAYAEGVGERLEEIPLNLSGYWLAVVKPDIYVSTKEAFSGVTPKPSEFNLRMLIDLPIEKWKDKVKNDFEDSIFPLYPAIKEIKEQLYLRGAIYASMSGSGSSVYGIYSSEKSAREALRDFAANTTIEALYLLKL